MTNSQILIRFDDLCPTMNWAVWNSIEEGLIARQIKPILAVVPDNRDPKLIVAPANPDFWSRVRSWQDRGWTIALHGWQHVYANRNPGIVGLNPQSEFAGFPAAEQRAKLAKGLAIFRQNGIETRTWVAPAHSFDRTTVRELKDLGIDVISDGLMQMPYKDAHGITWIPQQLWNFTATRPGVWTVCLHPNRWTQDDLDHFFDDLDRFRSSITDVGAVLAQFGDRQPVLGDHLTAWLTRYWRLGLRPRITRFLRIVFHQPVRSRR